MTPRVSRFVLALAAFVTISPAAAQEQQWIELQPSTPGTAPTVAVVDSDGALEVSLDLAGFYARDDAEVRRKEGLDLETGSLWGQEPPERIGPEDGARRGRSAARTSLKTLRRCVVVIRSTSTPCCRMPQPLFRGACQGRIITC